MGMHSRRTSLLNHISVKTRRRCRPSSLRVFLLRAPSSIDVPVLLLNQYNHSYDYGPNWTPLSPITIMNCKTRGPVSKLTVSVTNFGITNLFWALLLSENVCSSFQVLKTVGNIAKEAIKVRVIDVKIIWYPITKSSNWIPAIGHPRDHSSMT